MGRQDGGHQHPSFIRTRPIDLSPTTTIWADPKVPTTGGGGLNFNIQPVQTKPTRLQAVRYEDIKTFKHEFTYYHSETKGKATLHGHILESVVTIINTLIGAKREYRHLLGHGDVDVSRLPKATRALYPWLHTDKPAE